MLADYSEEDKILIKKECSGNFSLEVANTVFGLSIPHNPSGFFNSAKDLAISEGLKFLCEQHTAVEINSAIKKFHSRVDVELALKEQPICSQYVEQVGKDINALSKDIERVPYMVGAKAHGMAIVLQQLSHACHDEAAKAASLKLLNAAQYLEQVAFAQNRCKPLVKVFEKQAKSFNNAYYEIDLSITAEQAFQQSLTAGKQLAASNCPQHIQQAQQIINQLQGMLKDPQRKKKILCQKKIGIYQAAVNSLSGSDDHEERLNEFNMKASGEFESVKRYCDFAPQVIKQLEDGYKRWLYR